jgi:hypothetical protein
MVKCETAGGEYMVECDQLEGNIWWNVISWREIYGVKQLEGNIWWNVKQLEENICWM